MYILSNKNGMVVNNSATELSKELGITKIRSIDNYQFEGMYGTVNAKISTEPADENEQQIRIKSISVDPDSIQMLGITYHVSRGSRLLETYVELPVSSHYYETIKDYHPRVSDTEPRAIKWLKDALNQLAKLQGFDTLGRICVINLKTTN